MRMVPSAEFRRIYAKLDEEVVVTADGRPIGHWTPISVSRHPAPDRMVDLGPAAAPEDVERIRQTHAADQQQAARDAAVEAQRKRDAVLRRMKEKR